LNRWPLEQGPNLEAADVFEVASPHNNMDDVTDLHVSNQRDESIVPSI